MGDKAMNYPPMSEEKLAKLKHYYENGTSFEGVPKKVQEHLLRVKQMGGGEGIEFLSPGRVRMVHTNLIAFGFLGMGPVTIAVDSYGDPVPGVIASADDHEVVAADFCIPMLARAKGKYSEVSSSRPVGLAADALHICIDNCHSFVCFLSPQQIQIGC